MRSIMNEITISDLNFSYNSKKMIFKQTNFKFESGRIYLLTGENGSGKTTLMKLMSGLISNNKLGEINWKGKKYSSFIALKNKILYVSDTPYLYDYLTGRENLELLVEIIGIKGKNSQVYENVKNLRLEDELDKLVKEYSLGMKYKLFLVTAFLAEVDMILLDEPFSSLDQESQVIAQKMVDDFALAGGIVLISTHISEYINKYKKYHYYISDRRLNYYEN